MAESIGGVEDRAQLLARFQAIAAGRVLRQFVGSLGDVNPPSSKLLCACHTGEACCSWVGKSRESRGRLS